MIGTLIGGLRAARDMRRLGREIDSELARELARRNRVEGESPTRRVDAMASLQRLDQALSRQNQRAEARATALGLPGESLAVAKQASASAAAEATARIAAEGQRRRDAADDDYQQRRRQLRELRMRLLGQNAREAVAAGSYL